MDDLFYCDVGDFRIIWNDYFRLIFPTTTLRPLNMQIEEILNYAFPYTDEDLQSQEKTYEKTLKRERLRIMVERYKHGEIVNFDALKISVDIEEVLKRIKN